MMRVETSSSYCTVVNDILYSIPLTEIKNPDTILHNIQTTHNGILLLRKTKVMHDKRIEQALMVILTTKYFNMDKIIRKLLMYKVSKAI